MNDPPSWLPLPRPLEHPPALRERPAPPSDPREATPAERTRGGGTVRELWAEQDARRSRARRGPGFGAGPRVVGGAAEPTPEPEPPLRPTSTGWPRFVRTPRGAAGFAVFAAALLLWPFAGLSWIPWLIGFVALIVLRLLRLDGPLRGWDVHLAGLVVVAGLMINTTPWAWGLAASIGVLIAGLTRLPAWRLAALGALLCVLAGAGYVWSNVQRERAAAAAYAPLQERSRSDQGVPRPNGVLPILLNRIAQGSPEAICDNLLAEPVRAPFAAAIGQPDCAAAVLALSRQVTDPRRYADAEAASSALGDGLGVDACQLDWAGPRAGPQLGHLTITAIAPQRYLVTGFYPCDVPRR